jgi:hypothetical protein
MEIVQRTKNVRSWRFDFTGSKISHTCELIPPTAEFEGGDDDILQCWFEMQEHSNSLLKL